jgi:hypothetical protein
VAEFSIHEDRIVTSAITNAAAAGDLVVKAVGPGRMWVVTALFLQTEGGTDVTLKSGATAITGPVAMATAALREVYWSNGGSPIFRSRAAGDDIVLNVSAAIQVNGWVTYLITDARNV